MDRVALASAIREWSGKLGSAHVECDQQILDAASTATFLTEQRVQAILRPGTRREVQECVRTANRFGVPIYPVSSGKNWGYGSRVPSQDSVLLDLGRLNGIVEIDEELAYVTIEPGVTQRQLHEFLRKRNSRLWMDATGASPDCSIIGNTMERGFGHTPMGDHAGSACALEVVLPNGECLETGFGRFNGAKAGALGRWGVGPSLDGLFSQSNFGIVTRMTVWLMPAPESFSAFFFSCQGEDEFGLVVDALRPLRMNGTLRSIMHIGNEYKVLAAMGQYPWEEMGGRTPLDRSVTEGLCKSLGIGRWNGSGGLYGTRTQVREAKSQLRRALSGKVTRLQFVDDRLLGLMERFAPLFRLTTGRDVRRTLKVLRPVYDLLKGIPTDATLESAYWRKKTSVPAHMDPDRDGCGLLWCSPVVPSTGAHATAVTRLATQSLLRWGFEPQISVSLATERSLTCVIAITYDRSVPGEDQRALDCHAELSEQLLALGYPPYRLNVRSMGSGEYCPTYAGVLGDIKGVLDPNGVLAPGRYETNRSPHRESEGDRQMAISP